MKRLFFALWPEAEVREKIDALNRQVELAGVRKLKPQNLHMTLLYLGNINTAMQKEIILKVAQINSRLFDFQLDAIAYWKTPSVICLIVSQQPKPLLALVNQLVEICKEFPIHMHDRPYQAHVTLMRKAKQAYPLNYAPIHWSAKDFVLVESISTPTGIRYEILERWPLSNR